MKYWFFALIFNACLLCQAWATPAKDLYTFETPPQQQQFTQLTKQLRCLVCQNESLSDSSAPLAADLRKTVAQMVQQGKSDQAITQYMVVRYGNFVRYEPPLNRATYLLWFTPIALLMIGLLIILRLTRSHFPRK